MKRPTSIAKLLFMSLFKKAATANYPADKSGMPAGFRGKLKFDAPLCIGCKMCMRDCPCDAIEIVKIGEKQFEARVNLARCIYCGQCVDSCPKKALAITNAFELARLKPEQLKVVLDAGDKDDLKK
jgi:formate hydrogenlyase subunit 6/NADH:ubiquinone oxidoreductase subunit I